MSCWGRAALVSVLPSPQPPNELGKHFFLAFLSVASAAPAPEHLQAHPQGGGLTPSTGGASHGPELGASSACVPSHSFP